MRSHATAQPVSPAGKPTDVEYVFPSEHVNSNTAHIHKKLAELLGEMQHCKWDPVVFSETRANIDKTALQGGHVFYGSRTPSTCAGVAIAIHNRFSSCVQRVHVFGDRLMYVDLRIGMRSMRVVSLYMPHAGDRIEDLRQLYEQLQFILADARRRGFSYVVGGDFNSQLDIGVRGELLDQFCQACILLVLNRNVPVHGHLKAAWESDEVLTFCCAMFLFPYMQPLPVMSLTWVLIIGPFMDALMLPPPAKPMPDVVDGA